VNAFQSILKQALSDNAITLDDGTQEKLVHYLELMQAWNRVFNLTNITHPREMVLLHIIDSLLVAPFLQGDQLLDVGTGAGLPGIPLALIHPQQHWLLLDKNNKKTRFLTQVVAELHLANVNVVQARTEEFHPAKCFDTIISRAFSSLQMFVSSTQHLLCTNGKWLAMKGKYPDEEIRDISSAFVVESSKKLVIKGMDVERHLISLIRNKE